MRFWKALAPGNVSYLAEFIVVGSVDLAVLVSEPSALAGLEPQFA